MRIERCVWLWLCVCASARAQAPSAPEAELMRSIGEGPLLTEQTAVERALEHSPELARARAELAEVSAQAAERQLLLLPRIELSGRYQYVARGDLEVTTGDGQKTLVQQFENQINARGQLGVGVSELFLSLWPRYQASRESERAKRLSVLAERSLTALAAREAFYAYARARAHWAVASASVEQAELQRGDVALLVRGGQLRTVELLRADTQLASARAAELAAQGEVDVSVAALRASMGLPLVSGDALPGVGEAPFSALALPRDPPEVLYRSALARRPELQALRALQAAQSELERAAASERWPVLRVVVGASLDNPNPRKLPQTASFGPTWDVGAALSWSPNDLPLSAARGEQPRAQRAQLLADSAALERSLRAEVWQAHAQARTAAAAFDAAHSRIDSALASYQQRRELFRAGEALARDVTDDEMALRSARLALIDAAIDWHVADARLRHALGPAE